MFKSLIDLCNSALIGFVRRAHGIRDFDSSGLEPMSEYADAGGAVWLELTTDFDVFRAHDEDHVGGLKQGS